MLRSFFLAMGLTAFLLGLECLVIDRAVLFPRGDSAAAAVAQEVAPTVREVAPPDWVPWSLLSGGAVVMLYSFTLPAKMKG
ncbi:MAG: hypothetical protein AB7O59_00035 [Pirellulales bacterium]